MPFKTGSWGEQAKKRGRNRNAYFLEYNRRRELRQKNAYKAVVKAIRDGHLIKEPCVKNSGSCGGRVEGHHEDYNKPLEVVWLCSFHHRQRHLELKKKKKVKKP